MLNTVLPACERPVTPSRMVGWNKWPLNSKKCASGQSGLFNELKHQNNSRPPHGLVKSAICYSETVLSQRRFEHPSKKISLGRAPRSVETRTIAVSMLRSFRPVLGSRLECHAWCGLDSPDKPDRRRRAVARAAPFLRRLRAEQWQRSAGFAPAALPVDSPRD
jgi:hypothetical protein